VKTSVWALIFFIDLAVLSQAQLPQISSATILATTNSLGRIAEIRAKAEKGDAAAQYSLGCSYSFGDGVRQDYSEAVMWIRKAADQGSATGQSVLGLFYYYGYGVTQSYTDAVDWYRKAANQGDSNAQFNLGCCFRDGTGVTLDYEEAAKWFRKGAEQGGGDAQGALGACYALGHGVPLDYLEAVKWFRKAAGQGNAVAEDNLGNSYRLGEGVPQDYVEAAKWIRKAADQGLASAQYNLGCFYRDAIIPPRDYGEAVKWFRKAAEQGDATAKDELGRCYLFGHGVPQDYTEAIKWLRASADQGNTDAQNNLGVCYANGNGVTRNDSEAVIWFRKAADQGDAAAENNLGMKYRDGFGVTQDYVEAVKRFRMGADQGNAAAQHNLASCYFNGYGLIKDYVQAYKWGDLALAQGYELTREVMPNLEGLMTPQQIAEGQQLARDFKAKNPAKVDPFQPSPRKLDLSPTATGTGFFITQDGFLVTAAHVINEASEIRLLTDAGFIPVRLVKRDAANDLALLKAEGQFSALPIVSSRAVKLGNTIATVGFPNIGLQGFSPKLSKGEIASLAGTEDDPRYFQISVPVQPGNSGGALVDERGNVIGVVAAKLNAATALATSGALPENVNYAVKSSFLLGFLESIPEVADKVTAPGVKERKFEDVVKLVEDSTVLVLVY
jgi:TPR repeat protein